MPEVAIHSERTVFTDQPTLLGVGVFDKSHTRRSIHAEGCQSPQLCGTKWHGDPVVVDRIFNHALKIAPQVPFCDISWHC